MKIESKELFGREGMQVFSHRPQSLKEVLKTTVKSLADRLAIVDERSQLTYQELDETSTRLAAALQKDYQVSKGDRVAVIVGNRLEFAQIVFACAKLGAILVPINIRLMGAEIKYILENSQPDILILENEHLDKFTSIHTNENRLDVFILDGPNSYEKLLNHEKKLKEVEVFEEDIMFILYTSGTTGEAKGAIVSHVNLVHSIINFQYVLNTDQHISTLIAVPIYHVTGLVGQLLHMCYIGGTSYCLKRYRNSDYLNLVLKHEINFLFNVPTIFIMLASTDLFKKNSFDFVRKVAFGGAPIYQNVFNLLTESFPNATLHNAYGATETTSPVTLMPMSYSENKNASVGLTVAGAEIKVVNTEGEVCQSNEVGELFIKGTMVVQGYWENDSANQLNFDGAYWRSGDMGVVDENGFYYIYDRKKDMINRGGEKIFSIEVEDVLKNYPGIIETAVIGIPDAVFGEKVKTFLVSKTVKELDISDIKAFCAQYLAAYKIPEEIVFIDELPRNAAGKVLKEELRGI